MKTSPEESNEPDLDRREWSMLADRLAADPFHYPEWTYYWRAAFGGDLTVFTARQDSELLGVLALIGGRGSLKTPTNGHSYNFGSLAVSEAISDRLVAQLTSSRPSHISLLLPDHDPIFESITAGRLDLPYEVSVSTEITSPWVDTRGSWSEYLMSVPTRRKSEVRRRRRKLDAMGELSLTIEDGSHSLDRHFEEFLDVEGSGWKDRSGTAVSSSDATVRFYRDVAGWAAGRNWLRLAILRLDGRPIAVDFALESHRIHYLLKTGYDPEFGRFGPGQLLRMEMLERAFAGEVDRYEFMGTTTGDRNDWKLDWTDVTRGLVRIDLFVASPLGRMRRLRHDATRRTRHQVSQLARRVSDRRTRERLRAMRDAMTGWFES